jgi:Carboxypeptidase regulatory-like domain
MKKRSSTNPGRLIGFIVLFLLAPSALAQNVGSLQGTVSDPAGAAVSGAKVTATDLASGVARTATTDKAGEYALPQLPPGTYKVEVNKDGFKSFAAEKVSVLVATPTTLDVRLALGSMSEQVVVESAVPLLNTEDASVGNAFEEDQVKTLPFLARNVVNLLTLQPGVVFTGRSDTDRLSMGSIATLDLREGVVNGIRGNQDSVTVDGVDSNDWQNQAAFTSALPVTLDSVQEFRVTTTNANATNGLVGGAQVELVTKSGSNAFHGNARWYYRTTGTSANSFFNNRAGLPRAKDQRNIGGGSLGGPIKKDRAYFFLDNEERREAVGASGSRIVPSDFLRDGVLVYKCANASSCPGGPVAGITGSHTIPAGFEGLDQSQIHSLDPAGLGINAAMIPYMSLFPHGTDTSQGLDATSTGAQDFIGFTFNPPVQTFNNVYIGRIDYNITHNGHHAVFWRGSLQGLKTDLTAAQFPGQSAASQLLNNSRGYAVQYQGLFTSNLINTVRYGYTRQGVAQSGTVGGEFSVRSFDNILNFAARPVGRTVPVHEINDDVSWIRGKHTWQMGGVIRFVTNDRISDSSSFPEFFVNNGFCIGLCNDVANCIGNAACAAGASLPAPSNKTAITRAFMMLTGSITQANATFFANPSSGAVSPSGTPESRDFAERVGELYVQDSWHLRSNLTATIGLRWGYETPVWETRGLQVRPTVDIMQWFHQRMINMNAGIPSDASPLLSWTPAGKANNAPSWYNPDYKNFGPRLSLAYSPGYQDGPLKSLFGGPGKSSIRLGAGIFYDKVGQSLAVDSDLNGSPGTATALIDGSQQFSLATAPRFSGTCSPTGCTGLPAAAAPFFTPPTKATFPFTPPPNVSGLGFAVDPNLRTPYSLHLTASVQRELPKHFVLDVAYVGTLGRRLLGKTDFAQYLDIRDPKTGADLFSAFRQIANLANITPSGGPTIDPTNIAQLSTIASIPFFDNVVPNMPAFLAAEFPKTAGYAGLTPTQAFYAFTVRAAAPSWSCALFPMDTDPSPGGIPSPWSTTLDPQRDGLVLFQQQFQSLPGWTNWANSNFHSLQLTVRKDVGIAHFTGNYVFSKSIDNDSTAENGDLSPLGNGTLAGLIQNPFNLRLGRGLSDFNLKHNFNGNYVIDLPFGRGHRFAANAGRFVDAVIGGWEYTGTARWHSGFPVSPANGFNFPTNFFLTTPGTIVAPLQTSITRDGTFGRPNLFKDANAALAAVSFTLPGLPGSRNALTGPAYADADMGVYKTFKMPWSERQQLQLRVTVFNVFNSVNFNAFTLDPTAPTTFGNFTSTAGPQTGSAGARDMEFAVRFEF